MKINPHKRAFRAHRTSSLPGLELDEYLQLEWVTYDEAVQCLQTDMVEVKAGKYPRLKDWNVSWHIEEHGVPTISKA